MAIDSIGTTGIGRGLGSDDNAVVSRGGERFAQAMTRVFRDANSDQVEASKKIQDLVIEGKGSIQDTMLAMSNAEGSFRLLMEMRNRLVSAVNRILQTRV